MKRLLMTAAALALLTITAHAGINTCEGTVTIGPEWTTVVGDTGNHEPNGCRFPTASKLGRRIIAACPNKSECIIDVSMKEVHDAPLSEAEIRRLCPNPNARCLARDNPDFDKPPATIKSITHVERTK